MQWKACAEELNECLLSLLNAGARYPDPVTGEEIVFHPDMPRIEEAIKSFNALKKPMIHFP